MKHIVRKTMEWCKGYNRSTYGMEYIDGVNDENEFFNKIAEIEDINFFQQEDGTVTDQGGNEVFDPEYPDMFDFQDYTYHLLEDCPLQLTVKEYDFLEREGVIN